MLFMKKMIIILVCLCAMIKYNQAAQPTTVFSCTFNNGLLDSCAFTRVETSGTIEDLQLDQGRIFDDLTDTEPPTQPLSDATSVFSRTTGDKMCEFPYDINGWDMYFCKKTDNTSDYMCPTSSNESQSCVNGYYAYVMTSGAQKIEKSYDSPTINHTMTTEPQCLTFYYYFTNDNSDAHIAVDWRDTTLPSKDGKRIVEVSPEKENRWYNIRTPFNASASNYTVRFEFYYASNSTDSDPFVIAIDDISIVTGACSSPEGGTSTPGIIPTTELITNPPANTSDISTASTITNPPPTPPKNFGYIHGLSLGISVLTILTYFTTIG